MHWVNAALFGVLFATAAVLYVPSVSALVGRRETVKALHVWCGLALPLPVLVALAARSFRRDVRALSRWDDEDRAWIRGRESSPSKFNAGQKLNAAFTAGAVVVMLATGAIMKWFTPFPLSWRTGATLTHDLTALALLATVAGHVALALRDRDSLRAMFLGWVPASWVSRKAPRWDDASC